jgi:hypothetical protein
MRARASGLLDDYLNVAGSGKCLERNFLCVKKELVGLFFCELAVLQAVGHCDFERSRKSPRRQLTLQVLLNMQGEILSSTTQPPED